MVMRDKQSRIYETLTDSF